MTALAGSRRPVRRPQARPVAADPRALVLLPIAMLLVILVLCVSLPGSTPWAS